MTTFPKSRPSRLPYIVLFLSIFLAVSAVFFLIIRKRNDSLLNHQGTTPVQQGITTQDIPAMDANLDDTITNQPPDVLTPSGDASSPGDLVARLAKALESGDLETVMKLTGDASADPQTAARLKEIVLANAGARRPLPIRKVNEGDETEWIVDLPNQQRISLKMTQKEGKWVVESIIVPKTGQPGDQPAEVSAAEATAEAFIKAVINLDFEQAKKSIKPGSITDAKLAGLCILFEEGNYRLRDERPIRNILERDDTSAFLINLQADGDKTPAQFGMTLRKTAEEWKIEEINLDRLLHDYAEKFAQGDVYYTPLVKNPDGGDTLALYFDFDSKSIDPRATRQLEIVVQVLKADENRKINISGHTDALGTENYNQSLSRKRADRVRDFLVRYGVPPAQIVMDALGASQPRRPNVTTSGEDNPDGRRVNRRAEIYLDF